MSRWLLLAGWAVVGLASLAAVIDLGLPAGPTIEAVVLGGATAAALAAASRLPAHGESTSRRPARRPPTDPLDRARRLVTAGTRSADGRHHTLVPVLRELAAHRCRRHGTTLDDEAASRALLGDELRALVDPGAPRPTDPWAPGIEPLALTRALERLAAL